MSDMVKIKFVITVLVEGRGTAVTYMGTWRHTTQVNEDDPAGLTLLQSVVKRIQQAHLKERRAAYWGHGNADDLKAQPLAVTFWQTELVEFVADTDRPDGIVIMPLCEQ